MRGRSGFVGFLWDSPEVHAKPARCVFVPFTERKRAWAIRGIGVAFLACVVLLKACVDVVVCEVSLSCSAFFVFVIFVTHQRYPCVFVPFTVSQEYSGCTGVLLRAFHNPTVPAACELTFQLA